VFLFTNMWALNVLVFLIVLKINNFAFSSALFIYLFFCLDVYEREPYLYWSVSHAV